MNKPEARIPGPKWVITYWANGQLEMKLVYTDQERDDFITWLPTQGYELYYVYERV